MTTQPPSTVARAAALLKKRAVSWRRAHGGYTPADRYVVQFADGTSAFAKAATTPLTATFVRDEYERVYSRLRAPFIPRLLGWEESELPLLVIEDLSPAYWPPPWTMGRIGTVLDTMQAVRETALDDLPPLQAVHGGENWREIVTDSASFLSLGLVTAGWLEDALPALIEAHESAPLAGTDLIHRDIRSDNICFLDGRCILVDWNNACRGNGELDIAGWLPSLQSEGGPAPETILPHAPELAANIAGYFAQRAGLPTIPDAPRVRDVQLSQLRAALLWAQRALGLPLDGPNAG